MKIPVQFAVAFALTTAPLRGFAAEPTKEECIAASEDGQDLRRSGRVSAAIARFATCANSSCPGPVRKDCEMRAAEAQSALPTIRFVVKDAAGNAVRDVLITVDGSTVGATQHDGAIPVDVGKHQFEFDGRAAGRAARSLEIVEGVKGREVVVVLGHEDVPAAPERGRFLGAPREALLYISLVVAGVGVAGGSVLALEAGSTYRDAKDTCNSEGRGCKPGSSSDAATAGTLADIATGAFIVGGVALALAAWNLLTTPKRSSTAVRSMGVSW